MNTHCEKCGKEVEAGTTVCSACGALVQSTPVSAPIEPVAAPVEAPAPVQAPTPTPTPTSASAAPVSNPLPTQPAPSLVTIKCGNCSYIGPGEKNRSLIAVVLAWLAILITPLITLLYFIFTDKYRCPQCKSTFIGIQNKHGVFGGQRGMGTKIALTIAAILFAFVVLGIMSSVVLASLSVARSKGQEAAIMSTLSNTRVSGEIYKDNNNSYKGFCSDEMTIPTLNILNQRTATYGGSVACNDSAAAWAIQTPISPGRFACVDSGNYLSTSTTALGSNVSCPGGVRAQDTTSVSTSSVKSATSTGR